jgi:hypothetical protein
MTSLLFERTALLFQLEKPSKQTEDCSTKRETLSPGLWLGEAICA